MNCDYMTKVSAEHWDFVIQENLTAKEAVDFLKSGMKLRTFQDNLREFYSGEDLKKRLIDGLCRHTGKSEQSVRRKVNNWMQNRNLPSDREELFCICFLLELDENASDFLLKRLTGQGIHYRNTKELIYAYCLKYNLGYEHARELAKKIIQPDTREYPDAAQIHNRDEQTIPMTSVIKDEFQALRSHEELFQFILDKKSSLGNWHNTAYWYFDTMLELLSNENGETVYSLDQVTDTYLRLGIPMDKHTSGYNCMQKLVKKHWPGSRNMKAMKARTSEVTRKVLLLLYIATGGVYHEFYEEIDEEDTSPDDFLEFHCKNMNKMLNECGMGRIDPRNAFDFLILYAIRPEKEAYMSERITEIVNELFRDVL